MTVRNYLVDEIPVGTLCEWTYMEKKHTFLKVFERLVSLTDPHFTFNKFEELPLEILPAGTKVEYVSFQ